MHSGFKAILVAAVLLAPALAAFQAGPALLDPTAAVWSKPAPERFLVKLETSRGDIVIECRRDWAPHGADRFYHLVEAGFYDQARFFHVDAGRWAQFGINGDPHVAQLWRTQTIPDDPPPHKPNVRGAVAFAFAVPNGRTTQIYINLRDNLTIADVQDFAPFGSVASGMDVVEALNSEYGETAGGGIRAGHQDPVFEGGNAWLADHFPRLDYIKAATIH